MDEAASRRKEQCLFRNAKQTARCTRVSPQVTSSVPAMRPAHKRHEIRPCGTEIPLPSAIGKSTRSVERKAERRPQLHPRRILPIWSAPNTGLLRPKGTADRIKAASAASGAPPLRFGRKRDAAASSVATGLPKTAMGAVRNRWRKTCAF